jgi:hypothetical protein
LERVAARDYRLFGERRYFPISRYPLFTALKQIQWLEDGSSGLIPRDELVWRPIAQGQWLPMGAGRALFGDVEVRHRKENTDLAAWRISVLPADIKFELEPIDRKTGRLRVFGLDARTVQLEANPSLEVDAQVESDHTNLACRRGHTALNEIRGRIHDDSRANLAFSIPFPAEGAAFVASDGVQLAGEKELIQSRLYGIKAQSMSLDNQKRFLLRATVLSQARNLPAIQHHWFECPMLRDESGLSSLPLQQMSQEVTKLLAIGTGVDDKVKLELFESSRAAPITSVLIKQFEGSLWVDSMSRMVTLVVDGDLYPEYAGTRLRLTSINDFTTNPTILPWNASRLGWSLPDHSEMDVRHTYFATVEGDQSQLIRPCIIPGEGMVPSVALSEFKRALLIPSTRSRIQAIDECLDQLARSDDDETWQEVRSALKRLSNVHPHGVDLVECLIQNPRLMARLWFYAVGDQELKSYLHRITETSPFNWWMVRVQDWVMAAQGWRRSEVAPINDDVVADMAVDRVVSELRQFAEVEEELNAAVDLILEQFGRALQADSVIEQARSEPLGTTWRKLDALARGLYINEMGELSWPVIHQVSDLQRLLPSEFHRAIDWPVSDMGHQKSVMQAGVTAAAALHANVEISMNHRIALMAARNFHPSAYATNFRATQAALWVMDEKANHDRVH